MLTENEQQFIAKNIEADTIRLVLNSGKYDHFDIKKLANQINIRKKAITKLPTWATNPAIFFPSTISWQQCSSELTAKYKANLLKGRLIADLTGGFGVDSFYFAQNFEKAIYIEQNSVLANIAAYNYRVFNQNNIEIVTADSLSYLNKLPQLDVIYLDPARRDEQQRKIITLENSIPNIVDIQHELLQKATYVMVKTSPMLDIHQALQTLKCVQSVHVVAVENECKELLFILNKDFEGKTELVCVNITRQGNIERFQTMWNKIETIDYVAPQLYLYDPHKAIHKAGIFNEFGNHFKVAKLAVNTHLYTSETLKEDFQGRVFELETILKPSAKNIQKYLKNGKANIIVRNFPQEVDELKKKWKIKDGGTIFLIAVTLANSDKVVLVCKRI